MDIIEGSHGTSISRASNIRKNGWKMQPGMAGTGIYFWAKSIYYIELAQAWYRQAKAEERYRDDDNIACCIILVHIKCKEDEMLDIETEGVRLNILKLAIEKKVNVKSHKAIAPVFDLYVKRLEEKAGIKYKVLSIKVPTPRKDYFEVDYPYNILGSPLCMVVRDNNPDDIIDIIEARELRDE